MGWLFDADDASKALSAVPTPDLSAPPIPQDISDEPGIQDATVSDLATVAPIAGAAAEKGAALLGDEAGMARLGPLYHGSNADFTVFDNAKMGSGTGGEGGGLGHYLAPKAWDAHMYGRNVKAFTADLDNAKQMSGPEFFAAMKTEGGPALRARLQKEGYDGISAIDPDSGKPFTHVAFDQSQIQHLPNEPINYAGGGTVMQDSTLGDEKKGFQMLANKKAAQNGTMKAPPPTTTSMQDALASLAKQPQRFADGGTVTPESDDLINQNFMMPSGPAATLPVPPSSDAQDPAAGTPTSATTDPSAPNPITQAIMALKSAPDTNPNIYQGMTADDRLRLQQQLMSKMNSGGNLVAQGLGGIGDAVSNSFGGKNTHFQQDIMKNNQQQMDNSLAGIDTARAGRLQDIQGNQAAQMADPNGAIAQSMRKTLQSAGLKVPSGMSPEVMLKVAGPLGELALKQAQMAIQQQQVNATQANAQASRREEAAKALGERPWYQKAAELLPGVKSDSTEELQSELHPAPAATLPHGIPDIGQTFNGGKIMKVTKVK